MNVKETKADTLEHIQVVRNNLGQCVNELLDRASKHDLSKLESPEAEVFAEYTPKLAGLTYPSDEYEECLKGMQVGLKHHYANNRHHPEFHENGIDDMNLIDLLEMMADWKAATMRHDDGCIKKSLEFNQGRFNIDPQLQKILENTIRDMDW